MPLFDPFPDPFRREIDVAGKQVEKCQAERRAVTGSITEPLKERLRSLRVSSLCQQPGAQADSDRPTRELQHFFGAGCGFPERSFGCFRQAQIEICKEQVWIESDAFAHFVD